MDTFIASRISSGDNVVFPDKLEIDKYQVVYYKGTLVGYKTIVIKRHRIASVRVGAGLFFSDVIIESSGGGTIVARGFLKSDARRIMAILT